MFMKMIDFLLVFDRKTMTITSLRVFDDGEEAVRAYTELERVNWGRDDLEIVLLGADSIETLEVTHAHYFGPVGNRSPIFEIA
jgi:hypothetical protein